jgi:predicted dinucleotide-binding enzyme
MRIGIMGTGLVGQAFAARLAEQDHEVLVGTRDPGTTRAREAPDRYGNSLWVRLWGTLQTPMFNFKVIR